MGIDIHSMSFHTNYYQIHFDFIDCSGQDLNYEKYQPYYYGADAGIAFFSLGNKKSYNNLKNRLKIFREENPDSSLIICGNKFDLRSKYPGLNANNITLDQEFNGTYYDLSVKANYNFDKPLLDIARKLTGHPDLVII